MSRRQFLTKALFNAQVRKEMKSKGTIEVFLNKKFRFFQYLLNLNKIVDFNFFLFLIFMILSILP
jgi:hypothetical protein